MRLIGLSDVCARKARTWLGPRSAIGRRRCLTGCVSQLFLRTESDASSFHQLGAEREPTQ
jgi:hypothetical protein